MRDRQLPSSEILEIAEETARQVGRSPELIYFLSLFYRRLVGRTTIPVMGLQQVESHAYTDPIMWSVLGGLSFLCTSMYECTPIHKKDDAEDYYQALLNTLSLYEKSRGLWALPSLEQAQGAILKNPDLIRAKLLLADSPNQEELNIGEEEKLDDEFLSTIEQQTDEALERIEATNHELEESFARTEALQKKIENLLNHVA